MSSIILPNPPSAFLYNLNKTQTFVVYSNDTNLVGKTYQIQIKATSKYDASTSLLSQKYNLTFC